VDENAVRFVRQFVESGKPAAVICHGPWMLVEADVVRGRTLTSFPSLKADIRNAGGNWVDQEVVVMVGDTPWDVEAARRAGVETICVITGGFSRQELEEAGAAAVFESVDELRQNLAKTPLSSS
jgi:phosphoglycolate phosphatase-like HAD superfamily hydrolase